MIRDGGRRREGVKDDNKPNKILIRVLGSRLVYPCHKTRTTTFQASPLRPSAVAVTSRSTATYTGTVYILRIAIVTKQ